MIYNQIMRFDAEAEVKEHKAKYLELEKTHAQGDSPLTGVVLTGRVDGAGGSFRPAGLPQ